MPEYFIPGDAGDLAGQGETKAVRDVLAERRRQVEAEGWTPEHDDEHDRCELATAAACYAMAPSPVGIEREWVHPDPPKNWPWHRSWWKPSFYRRNLVKAGALIVAEIERWDRLEGDADPQRQVASAPTPDLAGQKKPVAWAYEIKVTATPDAELWVQAIQDCEPECSFSTRNIRPLYEAAPRPAGDLAGLSERATRVPTGFERLVSKLVTDALHGVEQVPPHVEAAIERLEDALVALVDADRAASATMEAGAMRLVAEALEHWSATFSKSHDIQGWLKQAIGALNYAREREATFAALTPAAPRPAVTKEEIAKVVREAIGLHIDVRTDTYVDGTEAAANEAAEAILSLFRDADRGGEEGER